MIVTKTAIPRRTMLRGVGTALALPLLDGMVPALTALAKTPAVPTKRLGVVIVPNGAPVEYWTPQTAGTAFEWTPSLKALQPVREHLLVMTNLDSVGAEPGRGTTHSQAASAFLTGARPKRTTGAALELGVSMDQVAANAEGLGRATQLPSLELSLEGDDTVYGVATCDGGFSCAYLNNSWANQSTPMPRETNPRLVFERLFGDVESTSADARLARARRQRSILDAVMGKVADLKTDLAAYDRRKLDEYLQAVRGIERRLEMAEQQADRELPDVASPAGIPLFVGRAREADVRPDGAGLSDRHDARHLVHGRAARRAARRIRRSVSPSRTTRSATTGTIPTRSRSWRGSTRITCSSSASSWSSCGPRRTGTARCWTTA